MLPRLTRAGLRCRRTNQLSRQDAEKGPRPAMGKAKQREFLTGTGPLECGRGSHSEARTAQQRGRTIDSTTHSAPPHRLPRARDRVDDISLPWSSSGAMTTRPHHACRYRIQCQGPTTVSINADRFGDGRKSHGVDGSSTDKRGGSSNVATVRVVATSLPLDSRRSGQRWTIRFGDTKIPTVLDVALTLCKYDEQ